MARLSREIRDEWRKRERDKMKIRTIGQAAGSVRNFPSRIYNGEQLEACRQLGPEIRRVGTRLRQMADAAPSRARLSHRSSVQGPSSMASHMARVISAACGCRQLISYLKPGDRRGDLFSLSHADGREVPVDNAWLQAIATH